MYYDSDLDRDMTNQDAKGEQARGQSIVYRWPEQSGIIFRAKFGLLPIDAIRENSYDRLRRRYHRFWAFGPKAW